MSRRRGWVWSAIIVIAIAILAAWLWSHMCHGQCPEDKQCEAACYRQGFCPHAQGQEQGGGR
jgi:hypothetical protein